MPREVRTEVTALIDALEKKRYYQKNPIDYLVDILKVPKEFIEWSLLKGYADHVWDGDKDPLLKMLEAINAGKWIRIEGGTGTSKTFTLARIVLWFLDCFDNSLVVTVAPKEKQLELHIWKEIGKIHPQFGKGELTKLRLRMREDCPGWEAVGFVAGVSAEETSKQASAVKGQGFHAEHLLFIIEEAPGVSQAIINSITDTCTGKHNLVIAAGNPVHQLDTLHRFGQMPSVECITISGLDVPNVVTGIDNLVPGAQSREGLKRLREKYHVYSDLECAHPLWLSKGRGLPSKQSVNAIIHLEWLYKARDRVAKDSGIPALGVDVANSEAGDEAAIAEGVGSWLRSVDSFACPDANQLGAKVAREYIEKRGFNPLQVGVDAIGVGAGTVNELKRLGYSILAIESAAAPLERLYRRDAVQMEEEFSNLRSQMWWWLRVELERPDSDLVFPDDEELFAQLVEPKWKMRGNKIAVEAKDDIKKRLGGKSPNKADAVVYWNWARSGKQGVAVKTQAVRIPRMEALEISDGF